MLRLKDYEHHSNEYVARKRLEVIKSDLIHHIKILTEELVNTRHHRFIMQNSLSLLPEHLIDYLHRENAIQQFISELENEVTEINLMLL